MLIEDQQRLAEWVKSHNKKMDLAVAFWGKGAIEALGLDQDRGRVRILLELTRGGTFVPEVRLLRKMSHVEVRHYKNLHAKAYIGDSEMIIGSANASAGGLGVKGYEYKHWTELGVKISDAGLLEAAKKWFNSLWNNGKVIEDRFLNKIENCQKTHRGRAIPIDPEHDLILDAVLANTSEWKDSPVWIAVASKDLTKTLKKTMKEADFKYAYSGWKIKPDTTIIGFTRYGGKLKFDSPKVYHSPEIEQEEEIQRVHASRLPYYELGPCSKWRPMIEMAWEKDEEKFEKEDGLYMSLHDFVKKYRI